MKKQPYYKNLSKLSLLLMGVMMASISSANATVIDDVIYFAPDGLMGAAAVVQATGQEISETMRQKIDSYLRAKIRVVTAESRYRSDVQRAMMDADFVLEIDGKVLKEKGELLTLTASEAVATYGEPPEPLLAAGIATSVEQLLEAQFGKGQYTIEKFQLTWSEDLAKWLSVIAPVLLGVGMLLLFIEFKTPGFGIFGASGIALLLIVFASNYVAGLAGYEPVLVFLLGIIFIGLELFLFPGTLLFGLLGLAMILGSIIWSLADIWPDEGFEMSPDVFFGPVVQLLIGFGIAIVGAVLLGRFLPKSWFWDKLILRQHVGRPKREPSLEEPQPDLPAPDIGATGTVIRDLHPSGIVDIAGTRFQARAGAGAIPQGTPITVIKKADFVLIVKKQ